MAKKDTKARGKVLDSDALDPPLPRMRDRFQPVVRSIDQTNVGKTYEELHELLENRVDPEDQRAVRRALSTAARAAYRAHRLYLMARKEAKLVELRHKDNEMRWRKDALTYWEAKKKAGEVTKQITERMLAEYVREIYDEAHNASVATLEDSRNVRDELEQLATMLRERLWSLRSLANLGDRTYGDAAMEAGRGH